MSEKAMTNKRQTKAPKTVRVRSEEMEWLAANRAFLEREHAGEYIAVVGRAMIAHGPDPLEVHSQAVSKGHPLALIHRVLPREYQGMKFVR